MIRAAALILAAVLPSAALAELPHALDATVSGWAAKGFHLKESTVAQTDGLSVAIAVYSPQNGSGDRLEAYVIVDGKSYLGYSHPGQTELLSLTSAGKDSTPRDLLRDGSLLFSYRAEIPSLKSESLEIVSYRRFKFRRLSSFPEGKWLTVGSQPLLETRDLPLGRFLSVGCEGFGTISQNAYRTRYFAVVDGKFVDVSSHHAALYQKAISVKEARMKELKGELQKNAGQYVGLGISVYYDYSAFGDARKGWARQKEFFELPAHAPSSVTACFEKMRLDLRKSLSVPTDWP